MKTIHYIEQLPSGGVQQSSFTDPDDEVVKFVQDRITATGKRGANTILSATLHDRSFNTAGKMTETVVAQYPKDAAEVNEPVAAADTAQ